MGTAAERLSTAGRAGSFASAGLRQEQPEMEEMEDSGFRSNRQTGKTGGCGCGGRNFHRVGELTRLRLFLVATTNAGFTSSFQQVA